MYRNRFGRMLAFLLTAVTTAAALTGCGGLGSGDRDKTMTLARADSSNLFREIASPLDKIGKGELSVSEASDDVDDLGAEGVVFASTFASDGRYYTLYSNMDAGNGANVSIFDADGKKAQNIGLPTPDEGSVNCVSADSKGRIYMVSCEEGGNDGFVYSIRCLGDKQKEIWKKQIKADENFEPLGMVSGDTSTFLLTNTDLLVYDNAKGAVKNVKLPSSDMMCKICKDSKGVPVLLGWKDGEDMAAWKYDENKQALTSAKISGKGFFYSEGISSGNGKYDLYLANEEGVFGFVLDGSKPVKILDFAASGLKYIEISSLAVMSADSMLILAIDDDMNSISGLLKRVDEKAASKKKVLTVGCLYALPSLRDDIYKFNRKSEKYTVKLIEYSPVEEDVGVLNSAIIGGDVPDILCINDQMPLESYVGKGVLEDLGPWFEKDKELSGKKFLDNIMDAFRINGKMYFVTPSFSLMGLVGSKKDFGGARGVSVKQLERLISKYKMSPDKALGFVSRDSVLGWITDYSNDQFVDMEKGTCSFDSESFIRLLNFAKRFPKKINYNSVKDDPAAWVREKKQLMENIYFSGISAYMDKRYGAFGEDIVMTGYPGDGSAGPVIYCYYYLAMCHDSPNKEACWDFLREYYLDEYQNKISADFPVSRTALERLCKKAMEPVYMTYTDEKGQEVQEMVRQYYTINGAEITLPMPEQKDIDEIMHYLETADQKSSVDGHIASIINEEVGAFFSGQKSAETTADIIQRRVSIYIKEMQ